MGKNLLREDQMTSAVTEARDWAKWLVHNEMRGPGDMENAMRRLEARYGVAYSTFWGLRYRPPKDMFVSVYERLRDAYVAEHEKHERALKHEREITQAKSWAAANLARAAAALAGEKD